MNSNQQTVLACVDGAALSDTVCDYAAWMAQRADVPLKLLHTIDHHPETAASVDLTGRIGVDSRDHLLEEMANTEQQRSKQRLQQGKALLASAKARAIQAGVVEPVSCLQHGALVDALVELENKIRVLVIGARGRVHEDRPSQIGAKLESMIRSLHRPILVVYESFKRPQRIMVAYDGSETAEKVIDMVAISPLYRDLKCHLVAVNKTAALLQRAADKLNAAGLETVTAHLDGKVANQLCDYQVNENIDLTVMGAFSHTRLHELFRGSLTVRMLTGTQVPLLLFR